MDEKILTEIIQDLPDENESELKDEMKNINEIEDEQEDRKGEIDINQTWA